MVSICSGLVLLAIIAAAALWSAGRVSSTSGSTALAAGSEHDCVISAGGGVQCWGDNYKGQLGLGYASNERLSHPKDVPGLSSGMAAVTADERHTCALSAAGGVTCWGDNTWGQMGNGGNTSYFRGPTDVPGLTSDVDGVDAGQFHSCALMASGGVKCWGTQSSGQLGDGSAADGHISGPVDVVGISDAIAVTAGGRHSCALTASGHVKCWGLNAFGQLGNNDTIDSNVPVDVLADGVSGDPLAGIVAISAGWGHTCALTNTGGAKCWGINDDGQLGNGTTVSSSLPTGVVGLSSGVLAITEGFGHTCALTDVGAVKCWGSNTDGALGIGLVVPAPDGTTPLDVESLSSDVTLIAAAYFHTCALVGGDVTCWGQGYPWTPTALSKTAPPTPTITNTPTVTDTPTVTPTPFQTSGTILVSSENTVFEYTTSGAEVNAFDVSYGGGEYPPTEYLRDITTNEAGDIVAYNGTFDPYLSTLDASTGLWTHITYPRWDTVNNGAYGGIAIFEPHVYVTDMALSGLGSPNGIVRFDTSDDTAQRFADGIDFIDLTAGLDGLLYGLYPGGSPSGTSVNVYDPLDMSLLETISLEISLRGIAVNDASELFGVDWDDRIVRLDADGAVMKQIDSGASDPYDIDVSPDGLLVVGSRFGAVVLSDQSLSAVSSFNVGGSGTFVAFAGFAPPAPATATPTNTPTATVTPKPTNTPTATITPTSTKLPEPGDTDQDGCTDEAENGLNPNIGGQRDYKYFWDFFDVWTHPSGQPTVWVRDQVVNVPGDIVGVAGRFGPGTAQSKEDALAAALTPPASDSGYHAAFDRGPVIGANNWNRAPADGAINIPDDIIGVAFQFGTDCS